MVAGMENFVAQDPYLKIEYGGNIFYTKVLDQKSNSSCQFNDEFEINIDAEAYPNLTIEVMDKNTTE